MIHDVLQWLYQNVTGNLVASVIAFGAAHYTILKPALAKLHARHNDTISVLSSLHAKVDVARFETRYAQELAKVQPKTSPVTQTVVKEESSEPVMSFDLSGLLAEFHKIEDAARADLAKLLTKIEGQAKSDAQDVATDVKAEVPVVLAQVSGDVHDVAQDVASGEGMPSGPTS